MSATGVAAETAAKVCSFAGATTVLMADGTKKPIEEIEPGDDNRAQLMQIGAGTGQVQGAVNGVNYVLGVSGGRIGQFYPGALP